MNNKINISELASEMKIMGEIEIVNERTFNVFSRMSSKVDGEKCVFISDEKYIDSIDDSISVIITNSEIAQKLQKKVCIVISDNPRGLFFEMLSYYENRNRSGLSDTVIGVSCNISNTAIISSKGVVIGDNVTIGDYVVIHPNTVIGSNVTIQSGTRIGEQDLNTYQYKNITKRVFHSGKVFIGDNVIICPNVFIGQALYSYGITSIGNNSVIGTGVSVGHNSVVGINCEICGHCIIGGYCCIGDGATLYLSSAVANNLTIGENSIVNMGSVVVKSVGKDRTVFGNPAREIR